jgi:polyisoprenoid-binding protein YceI
VIAFRFTPSPDGRSAALDGSAVVNRLEFGVGQGEWQDTKWLADAVRVRFALMLTRSESQR